MTLVLVALGGALGAVARYAVSGAVLRVAGRHLPWGTLGVNLIGSFALGVVLLVEPDPLLTGVQAFLAIGFLGDFTTLSTVSMENLTLVRERRLRSAVAYSTLSVCLCVIGVLAGLMLQARIWSG